jgi:hypothetical protein
LKTAYRDQVEQLNQGGVDAVGKEHFTSLYKPAREKALTRRNIMAGWSATGLYPFNPERVLGELPKLAADVAVSNAHEVAVSCSQDEVPQTPTTPVTAKGLISLHNIIKQDAHVQDAKGKQRLQKLVKKLASAAQISFAERALLQDQNRVLFKVNSETKNQTIHKVSRSGKGKGSELWKIGGSTIETCRQRKSHCRHEETGS